uniref:MotE family protein n=1 Tax=Agathobacter sp. TaxID=2021311 RepID=UPI0040578F52
MALFKKKDKDQNDEKKPKNEEEAKESLGSKLVLVFVTLLIILIWIGIIIALIKCDVGGFGSTILRPLIKDVPYINKILPEDETEIPADTEYSFESIDDAVKRIKELETLLDSALASDTENNELINELQSQINELIVYKEEQDTFEANKELFYEEVVFSDEAPDIEEYKTFYESIDPENAEVLYKQVVEQLSEDEEMDSYVKTYSSMKAKEAAAIFDTMEDDLELVADILSNMSTQARASILGKMDSEIAAKVTAMMEPGK